jgi:hypothetical protein
MEKPSNPPPPDSTLRRSAGPLQHPIGGQFGEKPSATIRSGRGMMKLFDSAEDASRPYLVDRSSWRTVRRVLYSTSLMRPRYAYNSRTVQPSARTKVNVAKCLPHNHIDRKQVGGQLTPKPSATVRTVRQNKSERPAGGRSQRKTGSGDREVSRPASTRVARGLPGNRGWRTR